MFESVPRTNHPDLLAPPRFCAGWLGGSSPFQPACELEYRSSELIDPVAEMRYLATWSRYYQWVVEGNIKTCFNEIEHSALTGRVPHPSESTAPSPICSIPFLRWAHGDLDGQLPGLWCQFQAAARVVSAQFDSLSSAFNLAPTQWPRPPRAAHAPAGEGTSPPCDRRRK